MSPPRITVESWDPEYGTPLPGAELEPSDATVDPSVELPSDEWRPVTPGTASAPAERLAFIDGVRRVDALVWITGDDNVARLGICASYAAGALRADGRARVETVEVRRGLFTSAPFQDLPTRVGTFPVRSVAGERVDQLVLGLQQRLGELEVEVATSLADGPELVVVDGPLSGRQNVPGALGYVKTHRVSYLPDGLTPVVSALQPAQRTPLFLTTTSWTRYSTYARLPGPNAHPWSGVVRLELSADRTVSDASALADLATLTLPRYASAPHKDPRAPQNLYPIAGLERELRRRLGDPTLVHRALRAAAG